MNFNEKINGVSSKQEFLNFLQELKNDRKENVDEWKNNSILEYLDGIDSWVEDMEIYYKNLMVEEPHNIDWSFIATLFYVGKIYE